MKEWIAMAVIITIPPCMVSRLGCSLIISHTQIGPIIVSNKKNRFTSAAGMNLGAMVTNTKGIATHIIHISGTIIRSLPTNTKLSINSRANKTTINFPTTAAGIRFLSFADLMVTAPTAKPKAVINPNISPKKLPNCIES